MPSPEFENLVQMFSAQRTDARPTIPELRVGFDMLGQMMPVAACMSMHRRQLASFPECDAVAPGSLPIDET